MGRDLVRVDAKDPRETGGLWLDLLNLAVSIVVPIVVAWISKEPREEQPTVPGFVMVEAGGARLRIDHRVPESERAKLIEVFLREAKAAQ